MTGTHGRSGIGKLLLGSVAETIFRHAGCPVLTVGPAVSGEPRSIVELHEILFATDFSESSLAALPYAISLAQQDRARLYLLHVLQQSTAASELFWVSRLRDLVPPTIELGCAPKSFIQYGSPTRRHSGSHGRAGSRFDRVGREAPAFLSRAGQTAPAGDRIHGSQSGGVPTAHCPGLGARN